MDNGLASNIIYDACQDQDGYIWFATDKGLSRFDGYNFKNYNSKDGLIHNEIIKIKPDSKGRIWFFTLIGKPCYYFKGKFYSIANSNYPKNIPHIDGHITHFAELDEKLFFSNTMGKIYTIEPDSSMHLNSDYKHKTQGIWTYKNKVFTVNELGKTSLYPLIKEENQTYGVYKTQSQNSRVFTHKDYYISSYRNSVKIINLNSNQVLLNHKFPIKNLDITYAYIDKNNKIWVGTRKGVYVAKNFSEARNNKWTYFLENSLITSVYEDKESNIWITTMGQAVVFIPNSNVSRIDTSPSTVTTCVYTDKNNQIWAGHDMNIYSKYSQDKIVRNQLIQSAEIERISRIKEINDQLWIIGKSRSRIYLDEKTYDVNIYGNDIICANSNYWIASNFLLQVKKQFLDSMIKINSKSRTLEIPSTVLIRKRANVLLEDRLGGIWIGMFDGLLYFDGKIFHDYSDSAFTLSGKINDLNINPVNGNLLIATDSYGLQEIDIDSKKLVSTNYSHNNSFSCYSITVRNNSIWLGTNQGIITIDVLKNNQFNYFSKAAGIQNIHVTGISFIEEELYAATSVGLLHFTNIANSLNGLKTPKVFITDVTSKNKTINLSQKTELDYSNNELVIQYNAISFKQYGNIQYHYMLEGLDKEYKSTRGRELNFKALPPGKYTLVFYTLGPNGMDQSELTKFPFVVKKPYWQEWWFFSLVVLFIIGIASVIWRIRLYFLKKEHSIETARISEEKRRLLLENQLIEIEQSALRLKMNPHFIFNALNSLKGYYGEGKLTEADEYLTNFSKILRHVLENNDRFISFSKEISILTLYLDLSKMRHPNLFTYEFINDPRLNLDDLAIPSMLLQPFVENSINHGLSPKRTGGKIVIELFKDENTIIITIKDNGIGYSTSSKLRQNINHNSKAIEITKQRLEYINQQSSIESQLSIQDIVENGEIAGTEIKITLPIQYIWSIKKYQQL